MPRRPLSLAGCVGACGSLFATGLAAGTISLVSQSRTVSATASTNDPISPQTDSHSDFAVGFGAWNRTVTASVGFGSPGANASASQNSTLTDTLISGVLGMNAQRVGTFPTASASSDLSVTFDVLIAPASYSIMFSSSVGGDNSGASAIATLTGPSGTVFDWNRQRFSNSWPASPQGGVLPVGRYTLQLSTHSSTGLGDMIGPSVGINWTMSIPAPGPGAAIGLALMTGGRRRRRVSGV